MKAIYNKPETEIVYLQVEEDIAAEWQNYGRYSVNEDRASGNSGFFWDEQNTDGKNTFFDD